MTALFSALFLAFAAPRAPADAATVTRCDRLAAYPADGDRVSPGIPRELMDISRARSACRAAVAEDPGNPRLHYQLGRVLGYAGDAEGAWRHREIAADAGYPAAIFVVGYGKAFLDDDEANLCEGAALMRESARAGAFAGQVGFVSAVLEGRFDDCASEIDEAELREFLMAAEAGAGPYYESLLVKSLQRELRRRTSTPSTGPSD